ncbi:PAS domain-containing protein [Phenylobacterium sp. LH3H17]|uniref:hybrid sensor histidine kinase/response regulator n=1 Tax=Phenylobacterium sp. LH3H17 TaxID=2903901 RepID=UPI0020C94C22|nr:PAS domain-containing sensor histidine kinase [Phenylobacterium sp. LH3H17]UTP40517.1 PAS domain-containing protein [Phenylobacterium sp. LH3H17]
MGEALIHIPAGGGHTGGLLRALDWSASPLGDPSTWPQPLKTLLNIVMGSNQPMFVAWGEAGALLYNDAYAEILAEKHPSAVGQPFLKVWAEIEGDLIPIVAQAYRGEPVHMSDIELHMERRGYREETHFAFSYTPVRDENGAVAGFFCACTETTAQVLADRRALEQHERYRRLFQQAPGFITILKQPEHIFEFVNDAYIRLFGKRDHVGRTVREVFPELEGQGFFEWLDEVYATGERHVAHQVSVRLRLAAEGPEVERILDFIYEPVLDDAGKVTGIFCEGHDTTETHLAQQALRENQARLEELNATLEQRVAIALAERALVQDALHQSQKMDAMGQLTGGVAHDFNNLLMPIIGSLDMLQRRGLGDPRTQRLIDGALESAERAKTLVQRLLAFARRQPLQAASVDVAALILGLEDLLSSTVGPRIRIAFDLAPDLPAGIADPNQLEMALLNLAVNSRDAMPDGGTLTIAVGIENLQPGHMAGLEAGAYLRLCVHDTGLGMDEETRQQAAEPFFSTKGVGRGTGLGLSMVHGLAAQLGGALEVESEPGAGTTIKIWLPTTDQEAPSPMPRTDPVLGPRSGTVLLVDDEDLVRASTADMLTDLGYRVVETPTAEDALRLMDGDLRLDLVITDHLMPGMTGADLARRIARDRPGLPVLLISGYAEAEGVGLELSRLTKPFRQGELAAALVELTGRDS